MSEHTKAESVGSIDEDLQDLYENAPCGYLSLTPDGCIAKVNTTFAQWMGQPAVDLVGKPFLSLLSISSRVFYETHFSPLLRMQGSFDEVALDLVPADLDRIAVLANAKERRDDGGRHLFTRVALFRAHQRRQHERGLHDARVKSEEANVRLTQSLSDERSVGELREQFIAVLGHDLRNPLAAIDGGTRLLLKKGLSERSTVVVNLMRSSVVRMSVLIDNVMDFARGRLGGGIALSRADSNLEPVLQQVISELRIGMPERAIYANLKLEAPVSFDAQRIAQLVSNLLANALTHGDPNAPVTIDADSNVDGAFEIAVTNSGEAISTEAMAMLFQPFFRGEARHSRHGLGLGLHIASEIAKAHGGQLAVESSDNFTRFTLKVPAGPRHRATTR